MMDGTEMRYSTQKGKKKKKGSFRCDAAACREKDRKISPSLLYPVSFHFFFLSFFASSLDKSSPFSLSRRLAFLLQGILRKRGGGRGGGGVGEKKKGRRE